LKILRVKKIRQTAELVDFAVFGLHSDFRECVPILADPLPQDSHGHSDDRNH
jgi:hypothetical protein